MNFFREKWIEMAVRMAAVFGLICAGAAGFHPHPVASAAPAVHVRVSPRCVPAFYKGLVVAVSHARPKAVLKVEFVQGSKSGATTWENLGRIRTGRGGRGRLRYNMPLIATPGWGRVFLWKHGYKGPHAELLVVNKEGKKCNSLVMSRLGLRLSSKPPLRKGIAAVDGPALRSATGTANVS